MASNRQFTLIIGAMLLICAQVNVWGAAVTNSSGSSTTNAISPAAQAVANQELAVALIDGNIDKMRQSLAQGANLNARTTNGLPPVLTLLAGRKEPVPEAQRKCLALLIEKGLDLAVTDSEGRTPLIHAARAGDLEAVRMIAEAGVYVRARDKNWKTALLHAAAAGHRDVVLYLASNGDIQSPSIRERRERGRQ